VTVTTVALLLASREWAGWAIAEVIALLAAGFIPVAIGIAILRYRLFDIDRLISRTPGLWDAHGAAGRGVRDRSLHRQPPARSRPWQIGAGRGRLHLGRGRVVSAATAAHPEPGRPAFQPIRYNAARTIEAFSGRLRDEIDLDSLAAELLTVVDQTVQPAQASLWLRPTSTKPPSGQQEE
jgi:hypothetical protein